MINILIQLITILCLIAAATGKLSVDAYFVVMSVIVVYAWYAGLFGMLLFSRRALNCPELSAKREAVHTLQLILSGVITIQFITLDYYLTALMMIIYIIGREYHFIESRKLRGFYHV